MMSIFHLEKKGGRRGDGRSAVAASPLSFGGPAEMECDDWLRSSSDFAELEDRCTRFLAQDAMFYSSIQKPLDLKP